MSFNVGDKVKMVGIPGIPGAEKGDKDAAVFNGHIGTLVMRESDSRWRVAFGKNIEGWGTGIGGGYDFWFSEQFFQKFNVCPLCDEREVNNPDYLCWECRHGG